MVSKWAKVKSDRLYHVYGRDTFRMSGFSKSLCLNRFHNMYFIKKAKANSNPRKEECCKKCLKKLEREINGRKK